MDPYKLENNPRESANFFSRLFFWWITALFRKGIKQPLKVEDLYKVLDSDRSSPLGDKLGAAWDQEVKRCYVTGKRPSLFKVLWGLFGPRYLLLGVLVGFGELVVQIAQPICLGLLIRCVEEGNGMNNSSALTIIGGIILTSILYPITNHTYFFQTQRQGMQIRIACSSLIYRKALQMNLQTLKKSTSGQIVNLLSNDVNRFDQFLTYLHFIWVALIQLAIVICILWTYFGAYCTTGISVLVLFVPLQGFMGKLFGKLRCKTATKTDTRLRILSQIISQSAIKIIKMQAWESLFATKVYNARKEEIARIKTTAMLRAINLTLHNISSKLIVFITLLVYVLRGNRLYAEQVFVTIAFYNSVRRVFTYCVPLGVSNWAEMKVSIKRIQEFLLNCENKSRTIANNPIMDNKDMAIVLTDFCASWQANNAAQQTLNNITLDIPKKSLVAIVGPTGSGKSSFLQAILHELEPTYGNIFLNGSVSYVPQESWIFEATIKENILFGQALDTIWYNKVIHACALKRDLTLLPFGDHTVVDKGVSLSGGQRSRINLARAVYSKSDIILLDSPLSAVDTQVANQIFKECILGLLKDKTTCILVTHQVQFLPEMDKIIVLENGCIKNYENYWDMQNDSVDFSNKLDIDNNNYNHNILNQLLLPKRQRTRIMSTISQVNIEEWNVEVEDEDVIEEHNEPKNSEEPISGYSRSRGLYWKYIRAGTGCCGLTLFAILSIFAQILFTGSDYWLQIWVKTESYNTTEIYRLVSESRNDSNNSTIVDLIDIGKTDHIIEISIYAVLFGSLVFISLLRTFYYFRICNASSINLHNKLFNAVLSYPMQFFQQNSPGKTLNVFSKDMGVVDELLPAILFEALEAGFNVIAVLVIVSIISPILLIPSVILVCLFFFVRKLYIGTAKDIKRIEGFTKSPVFSHMSSSLNGLTIIRAFKAENDLRDQFDKHQDLHTSAWFLVLSTTRWLAFIVEGISIMFIAIVAFSFILFGLDGPSMGLVISSAMTLSAMFQWGVRQSAEAESNLISVERISQYSNKAKPEEMIDHFEGTTELDSSWPDRGAISFENVTVTFENGTHDNKPVLHNLNFQILAGEKIGVVGCSGAGKSTLVSCLFRLVNPSEGNIFIDGKCISNVSLNKLRPRISIIPQEPVLFDFGTLRENLDPEGKHEDEEIWKVIKQTKLDSLLHNIPNGLDGKLLDKGSNFSLGEKQLFSLALALLQRNKILVLDEATASLDKATDELIQQTIRDNFSGCTTISIAHRLDTIIDCDKVLVLDGGKIMEFDSPYNLLLNNRSYFYKMVEELGQIAAKSLFNRAQLKSKSPS